MRGLAAICVLRGAGAVVAHREAEAAAGPPRRDLDAAAGGARRDGVDDRVLDERLEREGRHRDLERRRRRRRATTRSRSPRRTRSRSR